MTAQMRGHPSVPRRRGGRPAADRAALKKAADRILRDIYDRLSATQRTVPRG